ncbi:MAG: element excision factor XisI family protein [Chitinophagales bacterium]
MDRIEKYKDIIKNEMTYRAGARSANSDVKRHLVMNVDRTDFVVLSFGWKGKSFQHYVTFHVQVKNNQVWIYQNNTDVDLVEVFVKNGIPRKDIVIGFFTEFQRSLTEYAEI